ncbi:MAG: putative Ig domain-containing protein [candidate division Zixibacteria bacterium]|nr:putative Ig domain-containing protein [candidate division Zixibacteria bacterium]MDH3936659.1 putative Ig domain-containing protein [candidate division Zixibacteria bacterium]MDH4032189.1 putative Ig domain-containing protein [candidate division Zixibacteria bacterium]
MDCIQVKKTPTSLAKRSFLSALITVLVLGTTSVVSGNDSSSGTGPDKQTPISISGDSGPIGNTVEITRWVDPEGRLPSGFNEWQATQSPLEPFSIQLSQTVQPNNRAGRSTKMCVIVNSDLYPSIQTALDQYLLDLTGELYAVELFTSLGGTPEELRTFLQQQYQAGMEGCVLIGDLPIPWYETWCGDGPDYEQFPIDLFYMDLDGSFVDSDANGLYESHSGDVTPEIWMGRLTASVIRMGGRDEVSLMLNYFYKNHLYRCGLMGVNNRALVYIDDDWADGGVSWNLDVGTAYNDRTFENDNWITWADDYQGYLPANYEFIQVCVHSSPFVHGFKNPSEQWSYTYNGTILALDPTAVFYNLFACSNSRYVEMDNMGGCYTFGDSYGLGSIGSTKTGSMLNFGAFYQPFGDGLSIGEAFKSWFTDCGSDGFADWEVCWYYGMTLQSDPTLTAQKKATGSTIQYDLGSASYMSAIAAGSGWDCHNVRFSPTTLCTLTTATIEGYFPGSPAGRLYIWNSDGAFPTTVIDSVDIPAGGFPGVGSLIVDLSDKNLVFMPGQTFHIGITIVDPNPEDTLWIYMDAGVEPDEHRSSVLEGELWRSHYDIWGWDYNFLIRALVKTEEGPTIEITTRTIEDGQAGSAYSATIDCEGGAPPYTWDLTAGSLPAGMTIEPSSGQIGGTPTSPGEFLFTVRAIDGVDPLLYDVQHLAMTIDFMCADIDVNGTPADIADLVYLVDWMFNEGATPTVMVAANIDGIDQVDIADLVYLVDYMFTFGPPPVCE